MKKLYELLRINKRHGIFGVEIECEGENLAVAPQGWLQENDGSLRGHFPDKSSEYVFNGPATLATSLKRIYALSKEMEVQGSKLDFSFRTSVHVHVNVQDLTWNQYLAMLYTSVLMENVLVNFCGDSRSNNRFCLRNEDAEGFVRTLRYVFMNGIKQLMRIDQNDIRYSFVNIAATLKYGSIEYRGMRGTLDKEVLSAWLRALNNIRQFAIDMQNPHNVHDFFVRSHPEDFAKEVLKDAFNELNYPGLVNDLRRAFSLTLELPYAYNKEREEGKVKPKRPEPIVNNFNDAFIGNNFINNIPQGVQ
jgi:hypothetical protein